MPSRSLIVGLGEALFDIFPDAQTLGGAPLNVAVHAHQLAHPLGGEGVVVSRVGQDELGRQIADELTQRGMTPAYLQHDPDRATGKVYVCRDAAGNPEYDIVREVAWDWLSYDPDTADLAERCEAVCFGTLAQRNGQSRNTIYRFLDAARRAVRLFDVNLRQNYFDRQILHRSCEYATVVKLNEEELPIVTRLLGLIGPPTLADPQEQQAAALLKRYNLKLVVLTRGEKGTSIFTPTKIYEGPPASYPAVANADAVGAGDACAAAILVGLVKHWPLEKTVALANHAGAYVASQSGATPALPESILGMLK